MSLSAERIAVEQRFLGAWDSKTTPVMLMNRKGLVSGTTQVTEYNSLNEWCRLSITHLVAAPADIGTVSKRVRSNGLIVVDIFVKEGLGSDRALVLSDNAVGIFQLADIGESGEIRIGVPNIKEVGQPNGQNFYQLSVQFPFYRDEFFTVGN
jgi:hypothetical protein